MRPARIAFLLAALGAVQAQAGVFDDNEARRQIADQQIKTDARFDQQAKAQLDLASQIQRQADEIARLRGQIETLNFELESANKRQQDYYLDLDSRLRKLETPSAGTTAAVNPQNAANSAQAADPAKESQEYEAALTLFKGAKYKEAAAAFDAFMRKYPASSLAPNAQYWLGNAWYAQHKCDKAIEAQGVVTAKYADSSKAPDAWLAIATCQQELGKHKEARKTLQTLVDKYPNSPAAESAKQRLKKK